MANKTFIILIIIFTSSCYNNKNNINIINKIREIEPNNTLEYSQYIDSNIYINGNFENHMDIDYYIINATNKFVMDFLASFYDTKANIYLNIYSSNKTLFCINTGDLKDYRGLIEFKDIILNDDIYFLRLHSDNKIKYHLKFIFKDDNICLNEIEPNDYISNANNINYPNELIYGYFIKNNIIDIDNIIKPYVKNNDVLDIDFYTIKNDTDIYSAINIITEYIDDIDILLFDENFNYVKSGVRNININFHPNKKYYIALISYGKNSILNRYSLYYKFN